MSPTTRLWSAVAAALVAGVAAGYAGGATVAKQTGSGTDRDQVLEQLTEKYNALWAENETLRAKISALESAQTTPTGSAAPAEQPPAGGSTASAPKAERQFAFVKDATEKNGVITLSLDYAQFLTGKAAADAATAAGDESPPPNDYYIANVNPKLRTFKVKSTAKFTIAFGSPGDTRVLSPGEFLDAFINESDGGEDAGYWFTISGDTILGAKEQWTP